MFEEATQKLTLFVPTDNNQHNVGEERDKIAPNPMAISLVDFDNFYKIGVAAALSLILYDSISFRFPTTFWKFLQHRRITWEDYATLSTNQVNCLKSMEKMKADEIEALDQDFIAYLTGGYPFRIAGAGVGSKITAENYQHYSDEVKAILMDYLKGPYEEIRQGFNSVIPAVMIASQPVETLEKYLCGAEFVDIGLLRKITKYEDFSVDTPEDHPTVQYFWNTLNGFTQKQLSLYLRYVWGRSRLGASQSNNHKLSYVSGKDDMIPEAHTCFFQLDLFDYSSEEEFRKKLLYAIENCFFIVEEHNRINLTDL